MASGAGSQPIINNVTVEVTVNGDNVDAQQVADTSREAIVQAVDQLSYGSR